MFLITLQDHVLRPSKWAEVARAQSYKQHEIADRPQTDPGPLHHLLGMPDEPDARLE